MSQKKNENSALNRVLSGLFHRRGSVSHFFSPFGAQGPGPGLSVHCWVSPLTCMPALEGSVLIVPFPSFPDEVPEPDRGQVTWPRSTAGSDGVGSSPVCGCPSFSTRLSHVQQRHRELHGGEGKESGLEGAVISPGYWGLTPGKRKADLVPAWCQKPQRAAAGLVRL